MALKYQGDALFGVSLTVESPKPLDTRMVVDNTELLYSIPEQYAYEGMPVVNVSNGNIYVLIDKNKISSKEGWKASYETIQIVTCTKAEYDLWKSNTTDTFQPINDQLTWLHENVYYYIYEDSIAGTLLDGLQYISLSTFNDLRDEVSGKASKGDLTTLSDTLKNLVDNINNNYITAKQISNTYATTDNLSTTLNNYYTKTETDRDFVKKSDLEGEFEGEGYSFVTQSQYASDKTALQEQIGQTLKTGQDGTVDKLTANQIKSSDESVVIDIQTAKLNNKQIAVIDDIPKIITMSDEDYQLLVEDDQVEDDVYYMTHGVDTKDTGYVRSEVLYERFYTKAEVEKLIIDTLKSYNLINDD